LSAKLDDTAVVANDAVVAVDALPVTLPVRLPLKLVFAVITSPVIFPPTVTVLPLSVIILSFRWCPPFPFGIVLFVRYVGFPIVPYSGPNSNTP